ncbi:MAG: hypothetical protein A2W26_06850 [Acidobacteria bacterium RBG_16_64_8]|nr:MAG: hypothetical protein A2W26_06850 [Acidobacteria bacterium RBG_16_64_8]
MGLESPAISAVVARLADPEVNLAAYGGLVFPLALMIEAPIIMLLAASTVLSRDWTSYLKLRRFMNWMGAGLTALHVLVAATPLYDLLARYVIHAPEEIIGPARVGLLITIPWTWSIAYRRFHQGVLIRFGHSLRVGLGTAARFAADAAVLAIGYLIGDVSGIVIAASTLVAGVVTEAIYVHLAVRRTLRDQLRPAPALERPLTTRAMLSFYVPLSLTQLLLLLTVPIGSAAMSRMPMALESLAVWPVVSSVNYITRGFGGAYNEVVVALVEKTRSTKALRRFGVGLGLGATAILGLLLIPPVGNAVFAGLIGLSAPLPHLAAMSLFVLVPIPAFAVAQSYFQGVILHGRRTRSITESVALFLMVASVLLVFGAVWGTLTGIYFALLSFLAGELLRIFWLWLRSRAARQHLRARDAEQ